MAGEINKLFDVFDEVFGEIALVEWQLKKPAGSGGGLGPGPFFYYVHAFNASSLHLVATDFLSRAWEQLLEVRQLEMLQNETGIGGPLSVFVDYLKESIRSGEVKLMLRNVPNSKTLSSAIDVRMMLVRKSTGILPTISIPLKMMMAAPTQRAICIISASLFRAFLKNKDEIVKEQTRLVKLTELLNTQKDQVDSLQKQLCAVFSGKHHLPLPEAGTQEKTSKNLDITLLSTSKMKKPSEKGMENADKCENGPESSNNNGLVYKRRRVTFGGNMYI